MAAGHRHGRDHLLPQLVGELRQLLLVELAKVGGIAGPCPAAAFRGDHSSAAGLPASRSDVTKMPPQRTISAIAQEMLRRGQSSQSPQVPRTSITGRGAEKPASFAASRTPPDSAVVVDVHGLPAIVADQEDAVVQAFGMLRWRHRRWRSRPAARGWRRRTGRGFDRRCWRRPGAPAPSRPPRRCHRRSPACRSSPAHRTPRRACRSTARPAGSAGRAPRA